MIKDDAIGNAYFDKGAAQFFLPSLEHDENLPKEAAVKKEIGSSQDFGAGNVASLSVAAVMLTFWTLPCIVLHYFAALVKGSSGQG